MTSDTRTENNDFYQIWNCFIQERENVTQLTRAEEEREKEKQTLKDICDTERHHLRKIIKNNPDPKWPNQNPPP